MSRSVRVVVQGLRPGVWVLGEEASRYVAKVHRKRVGESVELFDPEQGLCCSEARILRDRLPHLELEVSTLVSAPHHEMPVTLLVSVSKNDKPEQAIRDATALGADEVVLVQTARSVAKSEGPARVERLLRVAEQVARQCERGRIPRISGPISFDEALGSQSAPGLICAFAPQARPLLPALQLRSVEQRVAIFVGPEGGFSELELQHAFEKGWEPVTLGPYVLRAEAAVTAVLAVARALWVAEQAR